MGSQGNGGKRTRRRLPLRRMVITAAPAPHCLGSRAFSTTQARVSLAEATHQGKAEDATDRGPSIEGDEQNTAPTKAISYKGVAGAHTPDCFRFRSQVEPTKLAPPCLEAGDCGCRLTSKNSYRLLASDVDLPQR